ncbi:MAG: hypothetical protein ISP45_17535 [Reyranella sp.]|jgi:hypothetical protein|nr:hypothetical protein [Reyranella sp.]
MINKLLQAAILVAGGLALGGCPLEQAKTTAPASKPPAADYMAPAAAAPPASSIRGICYNDADLSIYRVRMLQMELNVATLQCQNPAGGRAFEAQYGQFLGKFQAELAANGRSMQQLAGRKRFNLDAVVTEFANRTAQRAPVDKEFCARSKRAFEWAMSAQVTSLAQVPPPYDIGPEMNTYPCPTP